MVADYFTKPLSGKMFYKFRDIIMGYKPITSLEDNTFTIKERVENVIEKSNCEQNINEKNNTNNENGGVTRPNKLTYADIVKGKQKMLTNNK